MKPDRIFIQLHDGDDVVLIDMDAIHAIVGQTNSTVYFAEFEEGFQVDEPPGEVLQLMHEAHVAAHTPTDGLAGEYVLAIDRTVGYPR